MRNKSARVAAILMSLRVVLWRPSQFFARRHAGDDLPKDTPEFWGARTQLPDVAAAPGYAVLLSVTWLAIWVLAHVVAGVQ
jgi:hypothetical protein